MLTTATARPARAQYPVSPLVAGSTGSYPVLEGVDLPTEAIAIPSYVGDSVTVAINVPEVTAVTINGTRYERVDVDPEAGQYRYDSTTGELTVGGSNLSGSVVYAQSSGFSGYISDRLVNALPSALKSYGLARLTYSIDTDGQNSLTCQLICRRSEVAARLATFKPGLLTIFAKGSRWRLSSVSANEDILTELAEITLGFQSIHQSYGQNRSGLDRPILIKQELLNGQDECAYSYTLGAVAAKAGVAITGADLSIPVSRDVGDSETTTLRNELQSDRLLVAGRIVRWDKPVIEIVPFSAVAIHHLPLSAVCDRSQRGTRSIRLGQSYGGTGSIVNGVPLAKEWQNSTLELDTDPSLDGEGDVELTLVGGDPNPDIPPATKRGFYFESFDINNLRSMGWVFDNGGKTQQRRTQRLINGTTIEETIETYGFVYTSRDVYTYSVVNGSLNVRFSPQSGASTYWVKVRHEVVTYVFDSDNYLQSSKSTGWELQRPKKESDNREVIALLAERDELQSSDPRYAQINNLLAAYGYVNGETQFVEVAIAPSTTYTTDRFSTYYDDVPRPTGGKPDPRFLKEQLFGEDTLQIIPDPESTPEEQRPPITMGKFQRERQFVDLLSTRNPETYQSTSETTTKEGDNLNQLATAISFQQQSGRPTEHTKLEKKGCRHPRQAQTGGQKPRYLLSSVSSPNYEGSSDSVRFTGAYTLGDAIAAAKLQARIDNLGALTRTVSISSPINARPWDIVFFAGRRWRVLRIGIEEEIGVGGIHANKGYTLELGSDLSVPVVVETIYD